MQADDDTELSHLIFSGKAVFEKKKGTVDPDVVVYVAIQKNVYARNTHLATCALIKAKHAPGRQALINAGLAGLKMPLGDV